MFIKSLLAGSAIAAGGVGLLAAQQSSTQGNTQRDATGQTPSEQTPSGQPQAGQTLPGQTASDPTNPAGGHSSQMRHDVGHYITECLTNGNRAEIAFARIAEQRATDPEVKRFAQKMVQDHTAFLTKLQGTRGSASTERSGEQSTIGQQLGGQSSTEGRSAADGQTSGDQSSARQPNRDQANGDQPTVGGPGVDVNAPGSQVRVRPGDTFKPTGAVGQGNSQAGGARQFLQVQKEVQAQCLQSMTRELSQKEGAQFDRCYMHSQVGAHMKMADELTVYSRYGSENLQATLQEGLQTTRQHLAMAKQIADRLDGEPQVPPTETQVRRPNKRP